MVKYSVLHLDLNTEKYDTPKSLENKLNGVLVEWEKMYGTEPSEKSLAMHFDGIIKRACRQEGQRVAILVDEYDKPMLQAIDNDALQKKFLQYVESLLWCAEKSGYLYQVCFVDGSYQVW